jgi:adenosylcobinamide kinase/adenosylcobinamide-phosphate guanylyltransferase
VGRRLAAGARAVPDGKTLLVGEYHAVPDLPRHTLVLGGARSGKSAETRAPGFCGALWAGPSGPSQTRTGLRALRADGGGSRPR